MLKKITSFTLFVLITFSLMQSIYSAALETECSVPVSPYGVTAASGQREGIVNDRQKRIALTFDDGPHSKYTAEILDILKEYHVHATFFVVGSNVRAYPELVVREISEGHEVGNHTDTHPCAVNKLNKSSLLKELTDAENAIYEVSDYRPHLFRPPGGLRSNLITELADEMDYSIVLWSIDTLDWSKNTDVNYVLKTVRKNIKDGAIILCHDYVVRHKSITVEALKILIPELISQGYEFVLASELIPESK